MSKQTHFKKYKVFDVEIDAVTNAEAIDYIIAMAANPKNRSEYITKPYVEFLDQAYSDLDIAALLNNSALCVPDGVALNWAVYYLYGGKRHLLRWLTSLSQIVFQPSKIHSLLPGRAGGTNLAWPLLKAAAHTHLSIYLIGTPNGGRGDIAHTASIIKSRLPEINLVGHYGGFFPPGNETELLTDLRTTQPDLIMIGMGFPRQEQLMSRLREQLTHGVMIGEGGTFDYTSFGGKQTKAPHFLQKIGLEWLWRLILQPTRLRRQLSIPRFIWRVYRQGQRS